MGAARIMALAAPQEVRESFHRSYEKVRQVWTDMFDKKRRRPPTEQL
jgi:hypothetical protein